MHKQAGPVAPLSAEAYIFQELAYSVHCSGLGEIGLNVDESLCKWIK